MSHKKPNIYDVMVSIDLTKEQIIAAIRKDLGYADAEVDFDVSPKGNVRGATVKIRRSEIKHER